MVAYGDGYSIPPIPGARRGVRRGSRGAHARGHALQGEGQQGAPGPQGAASGGGQEGVRRGSKAVRRGRSMERWSHKYLFTAAATIAFTSTDQPRYHHHQASPPPTTNHLRYVPQASDADTVNNVMCQRRAPPTELLLNPPDAPGMGGIEYPSPYATTSRKKRLYWLCF